MVLEVQIASVQKFWFWKERFCTVKFMLTLMALCNGSMFSTVLPDLILGEVSSWPLQGRFAVYSVQVLTCILCLDLERQKKESVQRKCSCCKSEIDKNWFVLHFYFTASVRVISLNSTV